MADGKNENTSSPKNDILANMALLQGNKAKKLITDDIGAEPSPEAKAKFDELAAKLQQDHPVTSIDTTPRDVSFFLRRGTSLRVPLTVPQFGEHIVTFENATVRLRPKAAEAMRQELRRNARLAQVVFEDDANNPDMQQIVAHHKAAAQQKRGGQSGVDTTINTSSVTEFRDEGLYASQPQGRHADVLLQGKQAAMKT